MKLKSTLKNTIKYKKCAKSPFKFPNFSSLADVIWLPLVSMLTKLSVSTKQRRVDVWRYFLNKIMHEKDNVNQMPMAVWLHWATGNVDFHID